ncbi:choice-of-anchor L domain-containing protein [Fulvivirga maritima]|uniref:OmpA family protein n=1 Tax=Fulvivirga maritima TaxID=2904247 RepID=UPI001F17640E|nr:OmpA family protein [Fulvivirga maritima]UII28346.1 choice-of-anchor L domain-containing protein [Fulvivirga maritima]
MRTCINIIGTYFTACLLACMPFVAISQIQIDTTSSPSELVNEVLLGQGVVIGNVTFKGKKHAIGQYTEPEGQMGLKNGIVLTSGNAFYVIGPNKNPRAGWASDAPGDPELDDIARGKTYDASTLEFDFVTQSENLYFEYIFASEEYLEYVGSKFNDVFAFFINGPGMEHTNIAMLPDGVTPITVNTVNNEMNAEYYVDNAYINTTDPFIWDVRNRKVIENKDYLQPEVPPNYDTQFDGFTTVLTARCRVIPNEIYHIKMSIADVGDGILDSGVFLKAGSFRSEGEMLVTIDKMMDQPRQLTRKQALLDEVKVMPKDIPNNIIIGNIEFEFDKAEIPVQAKTVLTKVINEYMNHPKAKILLNGHTDNFGCEDYNIKLSMKRTNAVASALMGLGIPESRLVLDYYGEERPIATNDTESGRARNRRVELIVSF